MQSPLFRVESSQGEVFWKYAYHTLHGQK